MKVFKTIDHFVERITVQTLVVSVLVMLFMSVLNIVLRWFNAHVMWIEPVVRYLVVLSAFLGGVIATGKNTHIGIDIIAKYLESKEMTVLHRWVRRLISVICIGALVVLTQACWSFVGEEAEYGKIVFLGIHAKYLAMILPFGFGLMALRFFLGLVISFSGEHK